MKLCNVDNSRSLFPTNIDDLFSQFWAEPFAAATGYTPPIDVKETEDAFVVAVELPGVSAGDVEITVGNDTLTLKGEKKTETVDDATGHVKERRYGAFQRTFSFPSQISTEGVVAESKDGVLRIAIKKAEAAKTRKVEIRPSES